MGKALIFKGPRGTLKPGTSHKWFDELSRLIEWFLHADSYRILLFALSDTWYWLYGNFISGKVMEQNVHHRSDCMIF